RLVPLLLPALPLRPASLGLPRRALRRARVLRLQHVPAGDRRDLPASSDRRRALPLAEPPHPAALRPAPRPRRAALRPVRARVSGRDGAPAAVAELARHSAGDDARREAGRVRAPICPGVLAR